MPVVVSQTHIFVLICSSGWWLNPSQGYLPSKIIPFVRLDQKKQPDHHWSYVLTISPSYPHLFPLLNHLKSSCFALAIIIWLWVNTYKPQLVGGATTILKMMEFVNGKDDKPYMTWKLIQSCSKPPTSYLINHY